MFRINNCFSLTLSNFEHERKYWQKSKQNRTDLVIRSKENCWRVYQYQKRDRKYRYLLSGIGLIFADMVGIRVHTLLPCKGFKFSDRKKIHPCFLEKITFTIPLSNLKGSVREKWKGYRLIPNQIRYRWLLIVLSVASIRRKRGTTETLRAETPGDQLFVI